jgi:hypothetical protein
MIWVLTDSLLRSRSGALYSVVVRPGRGGRNSSIAAQPGDQPFDTESVVLYRTPGFAEKPPPSAHQRETVGSALWFWWIEAPT